MRPTDKARLLRELSERATRLAGLDAETDYLVDPKLSLLDKTRIQSTTHLRARTARTYGRALGGASV